TFVVDWCSELGFLCRLAFQSRFNWHKRIEFEKVGLKMGTLCHLASWVELAKSFDGSPNVSISPLISCQIGCLI
ncbi:hypothetical protein H5410_022862, partial [Solanum commersonii]